MALTAHGDTYSGIDGGPGYIPVPPPQPAQMPINPVERRKRMHRSLGRRASDLLNTTKHSAERLYNEARTRAGDGYSRVSDGARDMSQQTRYVARYVQNEYPLQLIATLAGAAFVVGMSLRIWRSRA